MNTLCMYLDVSMCTYLGFRVVRIFVSLENTGEGMGIYFHPRGEVWGCSDGPRQLTLVCLMQRHDFASCRLWLYDA